MSNPIIQVSDLSKLYKITHQLQRNAHPTLRDDLVHLARKPLSWIGAAGGSKREEFWALKDVGFEVNQGDVVGIMGRNGSGKSTLFKILSRVTEPTTGKIMIKGDTASLLEVGTGFHPELTGRENVYFNGAILGMSKKQIDERFDDIISFAEVERFLDTPVKFYSSGMKVRLAFSVAAFLDPEILIIDEVLAVGDVKFKKKSLERMQAIARNEGKTILFVSHIIGQVEKICTRGIILDNGQIVHDGNLDDAIDVYLDLNETSEDVGGEMSGISGTRDDITSELIKYDNFSTKLSIGNNGLPNLNARLDLVNLAKQKIDNLRLTLMFADRLGKNVALIRSEDIGRTFKLNSSDSKIQISINIENINLVPDKYAINISLRDNNDEDKMYFKHSNIASFTVPDYDAFGIAFKKERSGRPPLALKFDIN